MKTNTPIIFTAVILSLFFIFTPASAYTLLYHYNNEAGAPTLYHYSLDYFATSSKGNTWNNITRIYIVGNFSINNGKSASYTNYPIQLRSSNCAGTLISQANASLNINGGGGNDNYYPGSTFEIKGISATFTGSTPVAVCDGASLLYNTVGAVKFNKATGWDSGVVNSLALYSPASNPGAADYSFYSGIEEMPDADFTGSPTAGSVPRLITLTDTSMNGTATSWNWSISPVTGTFFSNLTSEDTTVYINQAGNYSITHCAANSVGSDCITKTDYVSLWDDNSTSTTGCLAVSGPTGQRIGGAQVDMYDIENTSWTNTTTTDGLGMITTLKGHTISCYGTATGFSPGDLLNQPEKDRQVYTLNLWPSAGYRNVSPGYVTLYITVTDLDTGSPIAGAAIYGGGNNYGVLVNSSAFSLTTNAQGMASVPVANNSVVYLTTSKAGYNTQTSAVNTGTGSGGDARVTHWIKLSKTTITPTATMTTLPGGGYPTATATVVTADPYPCDADHPENCERKQTDMANIVIQYGPSLVLLFICATIFGTVKMMGR